MTTTLRTNDYANSFFDVYLREGLNEPTTNNREADTITMRDWPHGWHQK